MKHAKVGSASLTQNDIHTKMGVIYSFKFPAKPAACVGKPQYQYIANVRLDVYQDRMLHRCTWVRSKVFTAYEFYSLFPFTT